MKGINGSTVLRAPARSGLETAMRRRVFASLAAVCIVGGSNVALAQTVKDISARQRYPWNNLVDIDYTIEGVTDTEGLYIRFEVSDPAGGWTKEAAAFDCEPPLSNGTHRVTWNPEEDGIRLLLSTGAVCRAALKRDDPKRYLVIDLSGGSDAADYPVSYLPAPPAGGWTDLYKTDKLAMRKIDPGTFMMGSPTNELGRTAEREVPHRVTLTQPFYIGIFQVTQKQYELVTGTNPSSYRGDARPVEQVSYEDLRGKAKDGYNWPNDGFKVIGDGFLKLIRDKAGLAGFDLPTDAQWEYACRAGTATALNSGKNLSDAKSCSELNKVGRYMYNGGKRQNENGKWLDVGTADVGSYLPNAWGLYDMHGNVWEWCRAG